MFTYSAYSLQFIFSLTIWEHKLSGTDDFLELDMNKLKFSFKLLPPKCSIYKGITLYVGNVCTANRENGDYWSNISL